MTNNEMNKDNNQSIEEQNIPDVTMKNSKETKYRSGLLSFAFYLSIIYLVLFVLLFTLAGPWGIVLLIFLAPSLICILIATVLTGIGKNRGNKGLLYAVDLNSRNGTYINGKKLENEENIEMNNGDIVNICGMSYRLEM